MFDIEEIMKNVPHRFPFLLIDRVIDFESSKFAVTIKNVSINEGQFQGHFPGKPVFPGVFIIENMAQSAAFLLVKSAGELNKNAVYYLGKVNRMVFKKPVVPGDQLITKVNVDKQIGNTAILSAESRVEEKLAAKGELFFSCVQS